MPRPKKIQTEEITNGTEGEAPFIGTPNEEAPRKGGIGGVRGKFDKPATPVREMGLDAQQQMMIVKDSLGKILSKSTMDLQGGVIPALVRQPLGNEGYDMIYVLLEADVRIVEEAWAYYKDNAPNPQVKEFLDIVQEFTGRGRQYRRVAIANLN